MTEMTAFRLVAAMSCVVLASCAAPKAVAVGEPPKNKPSLAEDPVDVLPKPMGSGEMQDGIRLPDQFLAMPGDGEFRATAPEAAPVSRGAVTVRPPNDPVIPPDIGPKVE